MSCSVEATFVHKLTHVIDCDEERFLFNLAAFKPPKGRFLFVRQKHTVRMDITPTQAHVSSIAGGGM
jgi:hypothetical protein